ncbi:MAG: hypothetical protein R3E39_07990 [Anaerolineae bacterium]
MTDNSWEKQWVEDMKSDDPHVYEPQWRRFAVSYWNLLEQDMERSLRKRNLSVNHASEIALYAWKKGIRNRANVQADTFDGVYRYVKVIGVNYIRNMPLDDDPIPDEELDNIMTDPPELEPDLEPHTQAMNKTFDDITDKHQEIMSLAWSEALDILMQRLQPVHQNRIMLTWTRAIKYMLDHPDLMKRKKVSFELLYELKPRHIGQILNQKVSTITQTISRIKNDKFEPLLKQFLDNE